ncbi:hypothetical protein OESDEN_06074 [Oesophagostomum dentatum]|uniref:Uncharacterized protein n=1 Tax=Oesophagostomum dentatum TaxID=61180 RepID=A0A0B1T8V0_OESDE|nr:hypothetical protein OESDEN_06074 [Oesophagostomum dentatum]
MGSELSIKSAFMKGLGRITSSTASPRFVISLLISRSKLQTGSCICASRN